jgi:hypothetical protein
MRSQNPLCGREVLPSIRHLSMCTVLWYTS